MSAVTVPCGVCSANIGFGMATCPRCARPVTPQDRDVLQVRLEGGNFQSHEWGKQVRAGSKWIGALAILFVISGPIMFAMQKIEADKALANLTGLDDGEAMMPIDGKTYTAGELRREIEREPMQILIVNLILGGLMAGLWLWSRRAPLPAIACALALYMVVQVVSGVLEPASIYKGIFIKLIALAALGKGLKAALAARAAMRRPAV